MVHHFARFHASWIFQWLALCPAIRHREVDLLPCRCTSWDGDLAQVHGSFGGTLEALSLKWNPQYRILHYSHVLSWIRDASKIYQNLKGTYRIIQVHVNANEANLTLVPTTPWPSSKAGPPLQLAVGPGWKKQHLRPNAAKWNAIQISSGNIPSHQIGRASCRERV